MGQKSSKGSVKKKKGGDREKSKPVWEWDAGGEWKAFDGKTSSMLEEALKEGKPSLLLTHGFFGSQGGYVIDLVGMFQRKKSTGYVRGIRRQEVHDMTAAMLAALDDDIGSWTPKALQRLPMFDELETDFATVERDEAAAMLAEVPELKSMFDRRGDVLVEVYMLSTLESGLPLFAAQPGINEGVVRMIQYIFHRMRTAAVDERKRWILEIADGYRSCQTVQQQILTRVYARLANVELTFEAQTLRLLSEYKKRILDELVIFFNPKASEMPDDNPELQAAHIRSAYLLVMDDGGVQIDGKEAAISDRNRPTVPDAKRAEIQAAYKSRLRVDAFVKDVIQDVNAGTAHSRCIDRDKFYRWVQGLDENVFDKHSIFYQEDHPEWYSVPQSEEERDFVPYLCEKVVMDVLWLLGLVENADNARAEAEAAELEGDDAATMDEEGVEAVAGSDCVPLVHKVGDVEDMSLEEEAVSRSGDDEKPEQEAAESAPSEDQSPEKPTAKKSKKAMVKLDEPAKEPVKDVKTSKLPAKMDASKVKGKTGPKKKGPLREKTSKGLPNEEKKGKVEDPKYRKEFGKKPGKETPKKKGK